MPSERDVPKWLSEAQLRAKLNATAARTDGEIVKHIRECEENDRRLSAMQQELRNHSIYLDKTPAPKVQRDHHAAAPSNIVPLRPLPRHTIAGAPKKTRTHTLEERRDAATLEDPLWNGIESTMPTYVKIGIEKGDLETRRIETRAESDADLDRELGL